MGSVRWLSAQEQEVFRAFARPARRFFVAVDRELRRDAGMSRTAFEILWLLARQDPDRPLRMGDLADALGTAASRVTQVLDRMQADGWVRRQAGAPDARVQHAVITDAGQAALSRGAACHARSVRVHLLDPLGPAERAELVRIGGLMMGHFDSEPGS